MRSESLCPDASLCKHHDIHLASTHQIRNALWPRAPDHRFVRQPPTQRSQNLEFLALVVDFGYENEADDARVADYLLRVAGVCGDDGDDGVLHLWRGLYLVEYGGGCGVFCGVAGEEGVE